MTCPYCKTAYGMTLVEREERGALWNCWLCGNWFIVVDDKLDICDHCFEEELDGCCPYLKSMSKELVIGSSLALRLEIKKAKRKLIKEINRRKDGAKDNER